MKNLLFSVFATLGLSAALAAPTATVGSVVQEDGTGRVTITYDLSEEAIVTLSAERKRGEEWVRMGDADFRHTGGAVNRRIAAATGLRIFWFPPKELTNEKISDIRIVLTAWPVDNPPDYMLVDLIAKSNVTFYTSFEALPEQDIHDASKWALQLLMRKIPAKGIRWRMGNQTSARFVTLKENFYIGIYELTAGQYAAINKGPGVAQAYSPSLCPTASPSYDNMRGKVGSGANLVWPESRHAVSSASVLGKLRVLTGVDFDLPTRAQWEFACRAGCKNDYNFGTDSTAVATTNCVNNANRAGTTNNPDGQYAPNRWGIYDMHGNFAECCLDWNETLAAGEFEDPKGPMTTAETTVRVACGGFSNKPVSDCKAFSYATQAPATAVWYQGFRLMCPASQVYSVAEKTPVE